MKILVVSDSHGAVTNLKQAVNEAQPDCVLHLGDCWADAQSLRNEFEKLALEAVPGNCDYGVHAPETRRLRLEEIELMMMHGHAYHVKLSPLRAILAAEEAGVQVLCFGHTHTPLCTRHGALWVLNPGACSGRRPTYGILTINGGAVHCEIMNLGGVVYDSGN